MFSIFFSPLGERVGLQPWDFEKEYPLGQFCGVKTHIGGRQGALARGEE
jgi:hypothetical protein